MYIGLRDENSLKKKENRKNVNQVPIEHFCPTNRQHFSTAFFQVLAQIDDKHRRLPEVRARQGSTSNTSTLQRLLHTFEQDIQLLVTQVQLHIDQQNLL